uniref:Reverse transcriptase domain-containing protein n=2 Tax=Oryzias melastigma TaxID=30732 RepID=A0A3B3DM95_ORYME
MAFLYSAICLFAFCYLEITNSYGTHCTDISDICFNVEGTFYKGTFSLAYEKSEQPPIQMDQLFYLLPTPPKDLSNLQSVFALNALLSCFHKRGLHVTSTYRHSNFKSVAKQRLLIILLLLLSGNVQPNPGPDLQNSATPTDFKSLPGFKCIHLNVRSLLPKIDMVRIWVKSTGADVVIISESWLTKSIFNNDISIDGYNVYRADRLKKGGGVAIYIKAKFNASLVLSQSISKQFEFLAVKVDIGPSCSITVAGCYRPPSASKETLQSLQLLLTKLNFTELLLAGDLNWDWLTAGSDEFKSFCDSVNLSQLVNLPTRPNIKNPQKSTLIDLILTNVPHKYSSLGVFCNDLSDHCVVAVCRNTKIPKFKPRIVYKRNMKHFNEQAFYHDLSQVKWENIGLIPDVEHAWAFFKENFLQIINNHAPFKKCRVKGRENPWFSSDLADMINERNRAWDKARKTDLPTDWCVFKQLRNKCTSLIKKAKSEYFLSVTTENLNNPQKFWKVIKSLSVNKIGHTLPNLIVRDSVPIHDRTQILNCFNEHFLSASSLFDSVTTSVTNPSTKPLQFCSNSFNSFNFVPFSSFEVHKALKALDSRKPPGPDLIESYFLKLAADYVAQPLSILFNLSIQTKEIPAVWKSAFVFPLLKGGDPTVLTNYRPISNLCVLAKILESLVCDQLKKYLHDNNILSEFQSGFRKKHSTTTATMKVINDVIVALDKKQHCASLFIDLSKAFDTVDHSILIDRLLSIGVSELAIAWFSNYLHNRTQCIKHEDLCSDLVTTKKGVPQGSVLGPLLFILYINDVGQSVSEANLHFYADDTVIYCCGSSLLQVIETLQKAFVAVQNSLLQLKLVLNADKSKLMLFSNKKVPDDLPVVTTLEGEVIEVVEEYKYLGVLIDNSLTFKPFMENLLKKLKLRLGFFYRNRLCFSFKAKKYLVNATFLSVLDYGDLFYMNAPASCLQKLDSVYHSSLRFISNCKAMTHHCELYKRVGWPSLSSRRQYHWHIFIYKALAGLLPPYICELLKHRNLPSHSLRSNDQLLLSVPFARTEFGKKAFVNAAPLAWNILQKGWRLIELPSLQVFKAKLTEKQKSTECCNCFF